MASSSFFYPFFPATIAFCVSIALLWALYRYRHALPLDIPNDRSSHVRPIPRIGGLGVVPAAGIALAISGKWNAEISVLMVTLLALFVLSAADDRRSLGVKIRLFGHIAGASVFVVSTQGTGWMAVPAVLAIIWVTNLFNFMDGADGLAGGMAVIGFSALAFAAGDTAQGYLAVCLAAAAAAFLFFNFPPAKVFLGDAGSIPLGFAAGTLGWWGSNRDVWPLWYPLLVFSPFFVDATLTLLSRVAAGEKFWLAHREHGYQRLLRLGWSHRKVALSAYSLMVAVGVTAILLLSADEKALVSALAFWAALYLCILAWIRKRWRTTAA